MKTGTNLRLCLIGAALAVTALGAQNPDWSGEPPGPPESDTLAPLWDENAPNPAPARSRLALELALSDAQQGQIEQMRERHRAEMRTLTLNQGLTPAQRQEQMTALRQKYSGEIRALLTPDQIQKVDQITLRERERLRTFQADNIAELLQRRSQLSRELGLSAEQENQLAQIREQQRTELAAMNQNRSLTPEQRREQVAATIRKYGDQIRAMLREDQTQRLDNLRDVDRDRDRTRDRKRVDRPRP